jgi:hypothetical protein
MAAAEASHPRLHPQRLGQRLLARPKEQKVRVLVARAPLEVEHRDRPAARRDLRRIARRGVHLRRISARCAVPGKKRTVDDVPTTMHSSAAATSASMVSRYSGRSPNHTTPGRASAPHRAQRGSSSGAMRGAPTSSASVPASAAHTGDDESKTVCAQPRAVQVTSKSRPCISRSAGVAATAACSADGSEGSTPSSARALSPSTFCVTSVNVVPGARRAGTLNCASARCAAFGWALRALRRCQPRPPPGGEGRVRLAAHVVELPDRRRVRGERARRREAHGVVLAPHPAGAAERRDACAMWAIRRAQGTGQADRRRRRGPRRRSR